MKAKIFLMCSLSIVIALAAILMPTSALAEKPRSNFAWLAADMVRFHTLGILQGDFERGVTFNTALARQLGFSKLAIRLGEQIAAATNDLITGVKEAQLREDSVQVTELTIQIERYPDLQQFWFDAAIQSAQKKLEGADLFAKEIEPLGVTGISHLVCGYYPNPKPSTNGRWTTHNNISNPAATLRSWGYHETWPPDYTGGGWTRPQTYQPLLCGWSTYRDHAFIAGPNTIREQNYTDPPGGEPNPEVYRSGPWPYPDWPAYVYWWHVYGPGR
jgi:hypothetical protein